MGNLPWLHQVSIRTDAVSGGTEVDFLFDLGEIIQKLQVQPHTVRDPFIMKVKNSKKMGPSGESTKPPE